MVKYYYDIRIKGKSETLFFELPSVDEEAAAHLELAENLANFKEMVGDREFEKFWTSQDSENAFRKYEGDVKRFCDSVMNPYMVKEVRDLDGNVVWSSDKFE